MRCRSNGFFLEFRNGLGDSYSELFGGGNEQDEFSAATNFGREWGWYATIDDLTNGDITKDEAVANLPMHQCLKRICYKIAKAKMENDKIKKIQSNGR